MRHTLVVFGLAAALVGCGNAVVPSLKAGPGLTVDDSEQTISLDPDRVPLLADCLSGEVVARSSSGWECVLPSSLSVYNAGDGISIEGNHISLLFGKASWQAAPGDHDHDERYRLRDDAFVWSDLDQSSIPNLLHVGDVTQYSDDDARTAVGWNSVRLSVGATDVWPGIISSMQITDLPVASWQSISGTIDPWALWPGQVNYSQIANAPDISWSTINSSVTQSTTWPGVVAWDSVKNSVSATTSWPGTVPYSRVTGAPTVTWDTIKTGVTTTTDWPGSVPYSHISGAPAVTWDTVKMGVYTNTDWPGSVPYTSITGAPAVTWDTVKTGVTSTTAWPGSVPYSSVSGAPAVTWDTVKTGVTSTTAWPGSVPYASVSGAPAVTWDTVKTNVTSTTDWPGTIPASRVTGTSSVTWDNIKTTVASNADWPGQTSWNNVKDVTSSTDWPGTVPYSHVTGLPDVSQGTVYQYATAATLPSSPADGVRAYLQSNLCLYQYNSTYTRWEVVNCDYYPDWVVNSGSNINFIDQNGTTQLVAFPLIDSTATRDFLYGLTYASTSGYYLEIGSLAGDDAAAPVKIRGRWQRCGYTFSGRSVCLPYLGMLRDTAGNVFEAEWMRTGTRTFTGGRTLTASTADVSLVNLSSPATTAYFAAYPYGVTPYGNTAGFYCSSGSCVTPQVPGRTRGVRVNTTGYTMTLFWFDESR